MATERVADIHRIGGRAVDNLHLSDAEKNLNPPGFSVLKAETPAEAAQQILQAFPNATQLHEKAKIVGSTTEELIRAAGFQLFPCPTRRLPNHCRITHPDGVAGFSDENLGRLSCIFTDVTRGEND